MPDFKNLSSLFAYTEEQIEKSMIDVSKHGEKKLKERYDKDVYSYSPEQYERTFEVRDAVTGRSPVHSNGEILSVIEHDLDQIHAYKPNQHHSVVSSYDPQDYSEYVVETIEDGSSGLIFGTGAWTEPRPAIANTREELKSTKSHVETLENSLRRKGIRTE